MEQHSSDYSDIIVSIQNIQKSYSNGFTALKGVNLDIRRGEILALLGPNGAGKTTLIGIITGMVNATGGQVLINGEHWQKEFRRLRPKVGFVPQELLTEAFDKVEATLKLSRGLFGLPPSDERIKEVLTDLHLWDKKDQPIRALSGGMKRRVLIAKALVHDPDVLFLDEPTAGVDVELRKDMWNMVRKLTNKGMTVILTTHYIEEAEEMADRIAVINKGEILLVQEKDELMKSLGHKEVTFELKTPVSSLPQTLADCSLELKEGGHQLVYHYNKNAKETSNGINELMHKLNAEGLEITDIQTRESSLEEIFVNLLEEYQ